CIRSVKCFYSFPTRRSSDLAFGVSQSLQEHLQSDIIRSNRFALVNREYGEEFASEKALLSSNNVSAETASRIGEVAGADYMLVRSEEHTSELQSRFDLVCRL